MTSFHECLMEYRNQLKKGDIQVAYKGLLEYIMELRRYFENQYPDYFVSGIYQGYMDMTYFSFSPKPMTAQKLRIALVFLHKEFRFEAWLAGYNKQIQAKYWKMIKESGWHQYTLVPSIKGADSIIECILVDDPDFRSPDALTERIETAALRFIGDVENFLASHSN